MSRNFHGEHIHSQSISMDRHYFQPVLKKFTRSLLMSTAPETATATATATTIEDDAATKNRKIEAMVATKKRKLEEMEKRDEKRQTEFEKARLATGDGLCASTGNRQLKFANSQPGLGVVIDEFGGDINWDVSVRRDKQGLVTEVIMRTTSNGKPVGKKEKVGTVCIDAGAFLIADPCYIFP
jgi:hypothetical protein